MKELNKTMYFKATPTIMHTARMLRENMTTCEKTLWEKLKKSPLGDLGVKYVGDHYVR
jgi:very-short-patch-repair endonuclease